MIIGLYFDIYKDKIISKIENFILKINCNCIVCNKLPNIIKKLSKKYRINVVSYRSKSKKKTKRYIFKNSDLILTKK